MGQLAQTANGTRLARANPSAGIQQMLAHNWDRIAAVMPRHMSSERLFQLAVSTINQTPQLAQADPASLLSCVMKCSALGLEPSAVDGLGRAYILPFRNHGRMQAQFVMGYKGMIDLARRSGQLKSIHAQAVYEGDEYERWEDETGQHFRFVSHDVPHTADRLTDVYVCAQLKEGGFVFETMTKAEVDAIRKRSKASGSGPWVTDYEAMALKTVIRRSFRYLPVSVEAQQAAASDETTPDYGGLLNPVIAGGDETARDDGPTHGSDATVDTKEVTTDEHDAEEAEQAALAGQAEHEAERRAPDDDADQPDLADADYEF